MANRNFNRYQALEKEVKTLFAKVTIGASGAPTLVTTQSMGIASISRTSAGLYVLTLQDKYMKLLHARIEVVTPSAEDVHSNLVSETVSSTKTITFRVCTGATPTDPASGDSLLIRLDVKNSSI